jgi:hypothetical protein
MKKLLAGFVAVLLAAPLVVSAQTTWKNSAALMDQAKLESAPRYERRAGMERSPSASPSTASPTAKPYNPNKQ